MSDVGDPRIPSLGIDLDIRTDLPRYRVWRDGEVVEEPTDIMAHWRDDLVAFVLGCSFSFEEALMADDLPIRHIERNVRVPMYRTNIACAPSGPFAGPMVVSMRPFKPADAIRAVQITSRFPSVHGAPVHLGHPHSIGIADIAKPDYGDAVPVEADEIPVFWACGVTPQAVIAAAKLPFAITHAPGLMLVTDLRTSNLLCFNGQPVLFFEALPLLFNRFIDSAGQQRIFAMTISRRNVLLGATATAALLPIAARAQTPEVAIGIIYPFSGASAQIGVDAQKAFETAAEIINKNTISICRWRGARDCPVSAAPRSAWCSPITRPIRRRAAPKPSA